LKTPNQKQKARKGVIYIIYEKVNGIWYVCYVGQTVNRRKRRNSHWRTASAAPKQPDDRTLLHRKMHAHGVENFKFEVVAEADAAKLDDLEQLYIEKFNTHSDRKMGGYNLDKGGRLNRGGFSEESRRRMSEDRKARWTDPMTRVVWSALMKALHETHPEIRLQKSASRMALLAAHPELLLEQSAVMKKYHASHPERAREHSIFMTNSWEDEEFRRGMIESQESSYVDDPKRASKHSKDMKRCWKNL
jgi:group I intron endonuclease